MKRRSFIQGLLGMAAASLTPAALVRETPDLLKRAQPTKSMPAFWSTTYCRLPVAPIDMADHARDKARLSAWAAALGLTDILENDALQEDLARQGYRIDYRAMQRAIIELSERLV